MSSSFLWHTQSVDSVAHELNTNPKNGLSNKEASIRLGTYGFNQIPRRTGIPWLNIILRQQISLMIPLILISIILLFFNKILIGGLVLMFLLVIGIIFSIFQEFKSEKLMQTLRKSADDSNYTKVIRNSNVNFVRAKDLVPGDIMYFDKGDQIPADGRLFVAEDLTIDESIFDETIEPVEKIIDTISPDIQSQASQSIKNMVYMGTKVSRGKGLAITTATGSQTRIAQNLSQFKEAEHFQPWLLEIGISKKGLLFAIGCIICFAILWLILSYMKITLSKSFIISTGFLMAIWPMGLIETIRTAMVVGMQRLRERQIIIRNPAGTEKLASATVICSSKTGVMTENQMVVRKIFIDGSIIDVEGEGYNPNSGGFPPEAEDEYPDLPLLLSMAAMCNNTEVKDTPEGWSVFGNPVEGALIVAAMKGGLKKDEVALTLSQLGEIPFDPGRKRMSVIYKEPNGGVFIFTKGSVESVLDICTDVQLYENIDPMTPGKYNAIKAVNHNFASLGMRSLVFAYRKLDSEPSSYIASDLEKNMVFIGVIGISDSVRSNINSLVEKCNVGNIKPIIFTDEPADTATSFANSLKLLAENSSVITGEDLDLQNEREDQDLVEKASIYAEILPLHKVRIINALKENKKITAVIGENEDDAEAIREADVGIAANPTCSSAAIGSSDLVLNDGSFATAINAIQIMRGTYGNAKRLIRYSLSGSLGIAITILGILLISIFWNSSSPLSKDAIYMILSYTLWVNILAIFVPAFAMAFNPATDDVMKEGPYLVGNILDRVTIFRILIKGLITAILAFIVYVFSMGISNNQYFGITAVMTFLIMSQLAFAFQCRRTPDDSLLRGFYANRLMLLLALIIILLHFWIIYIPALGRIFNTRPISFIHWMPIIIGVVISFLPFDEIILRNIFSIIGNKKSDKIKNSEVKTPDGDSLEEEKKGEDQG